MQACCVSRKGQDESDSVNSYRDSCGGVGSIFDNLWPHAKGGTDALQHTEDDEAEEEQRSEETVQRHSKAFGNEPNLMVYMVTDPLEEDLRKEPATGCKPTSRRKQRAYHIPPNTLEGVPIETECFVGKVIVMYKPDGGLQKCDRGTEHPYYRYFVKKKRNWEFRVQGRFKRVPRGDMFIGIVLRDFNYDQAVAPYSMIVKRAGTALVKYDLYMSWGDRCAASKKPNAELSHLVTKMTAWDQIIVTPSGKTVPLLKGELHGISDTFGLNLERKEMGLARYTQAIAELYQNINTEDTYTMCFWGVSQVIDLLCWNFKIGANIPMAKFFEDDPIHVAMYELEPLEEGQEDDKRHLESRKRYYLDFMFWSSSVHCPRLPKRYAFKDAPEALEQFSAKHCSANGTFVAGQQSRSEEPPASGTTGNSSSSRPSVLASWASLLRLDIHVTATVRLPKMPLPLIPAAQPGSPGCASGAKCVGKPGKDLHTDDFDANKMVYCLSCWEVEPEGGKAPGADGTADVATHSVAGISDALSKRIVAAFRGEEPPLLYPRVELHAALDSGSDEVLIGNACIVLVDSQDADGVGCYTIAVFLLKKDSSPQDPLFKVPIGPMTRLAREKVGKTGDHGCSNTALRLTSGANSWLLLFPGSHEASAFARDFRVRSQLMKLSLKVSRLSAENARLVDKTSAGGLMKSFIAVLPAV
eukprot:CAMPEP_0179145980 /NCGR_PEP_ID=MMETSP0796-20121207/70467_1 /TAXON_ID=73915 /ORGANISM="Pyrodinium bahamense, Strain pbaha01" /LENGTH=696 /DNA_ID=CAMNT_0020846423 /DNA_START=99 /DNA_END=2186 /DNA_ORIENTATION=-